jgi:hypothetical protein
MAYLAVYKGRILTTAEITELDAQLPIDGIDITRSITPNGSPQTVTTTISGQKARLILSAALGQIATVQLSNNTMGSVTVSLLNPNGTTLASSSSNATTFSLTPSRLQLSGAYAVLIQSNGTNVGSLTVGVSVTDLPSRPTGSTLDTNNSLSTNLVGLFLMNEATGTYDENLADSEDANFAGANSPTWNISDPSIVFNGGSSQNSYLNAGTDLIFDQLTPGQITVVAKVYVNGITAAGIAEKNDNNAVDSGFVFGWNSSGAIDLVVEKTVANMRVSTATAAVTTGQWQQVAFTWDGSIGTASAAHLFVNGAEQTKASSTDGSGTIGYRNATNQPFRIGNASFDFAGSLNGKIGYLAVYKGRILTTSQMNQLDARLPIH